MWLGYPVHPDCGAARPFDFKTQTTRVKYWLAAKCSSTILKKGRRAFGRDRNPQSEVYTPATTSSTRWSTTQPRIAFVASSTYIVPYKKPLIMQETTKMPRNYYHLHTWQT